MKKAIFTLVLSICVTAVFTQVQNAGGTITVENGATLVIEGDYTSTSSGVIEINGTVELKGDLVNTSGSIGAGSTGRLKLNGTSAQEITGATSTTYYCAVEVDNSNGVALTSTSTGAPQVLDSTLILTSGSVTLNAFDLTLSDEGVTGASTSQWVVTNSTGELKSVVGSTDVNFPVGNTTYNPITLNNSGTSDTYGVIASDGVPTNWTTNDHAVDRSWTVTEAVGGGSDLAATAQWNLAEEETAFDRTDCAVGLTADNGTSFTWAASGASTGSDPYARIGSGFTTVGDFVVGDYYHEGIELDLKLFLAGPYNGSTMNTGLTVPTTDPYGLSTSVTSIPTNTVDWIQVDLLDGTTPSAASPINSYAFFLRNDGEILNTDGSADVKITGVMKASYNVAVYHRNHLAACTGSSVDFSATSPSFDFTNPASSFYGTNALRDISGVMVLWAGDTDGNGIIEFARATSDITPISSYVINYPGNTLNDPTFATSVDYDDADADMNGLVEFARATSDITPISASVIGNPANTLSDPTMALFEQLP